MAVAVLVVVVVVGMLKALLPQQISLIPLSLEGEDLLPHPLAIQVETVAQALPFLFPLWAGVEVDAAPTEPTVGMAAVVQPIANSEVEALAILGSMEERMAALMAVVEVVAGQVKQEALAVAQMAAMVAMA